LATVVTQIDGLLIPSSLLIVAPVWFKPLLAHISYPYGGVKYPLTVFARKP